MMTGKSGRRVLISCSSASPVHAGHVDVAEDHDQRRLDAVGELIERLLAGDGEVQHVGALAHLAAEALAEKIGDIRFVVDNKNADAHAALPFVAI